MTLKNKVSIAAIFLIVALFYSCASAPSMEAVSAQRSALASEARMIAYTIYLELEVKNIDESKKNIAAETGTFNGYITEESKNYVTSRIPVGNMDAYLEKIKTMGKVKQEHKTGNDITDQYRDNAIRLESLKTVRARYGALLEKATGVTEMVSIEKELERINTEIELLEGRMKYAEQSVDYTKITVRLAEKTSPGPIGWIFYGLYSGINWLFVWN
jgi:hypothetical protein